MKREKYINVMGHSIIKNSFWTSSFDPFTLIEKPENISEKEFNFIKEALEPLKGKKFKYFFRFTTNFDIIFSEALRYFPDDDRYCDTDWGWKRLMDAISILGLKPEMEKKMFQIFKDQIIKERKKERFYLDVPKISSKKNDPFFKDDYVFLANRRLIFSKEGVFKVPNGAELFVDAEGNKFLDLKTAKGPYSENQELIFRPKRPDREPIYSKDLKLPVKLQKEDTVKIEKIEVKSSRQMITYQAFLLYRSFDHVVNERCTGNLRSMTVKKVSLYEIIATILKAKWKPISDRMKKVTAADIKSYVYDVEKKDKQKKELISLSNYLLTPHP